MKSLQDAKKIPTEPEPSNIACPHCSKEMLRHGTVAFGRFDGRVVVGPALICHECGYVEELG